MAKFAELVVRPALVNGLQTTVGEAVVGEPQVKRSPVYTVTRRDPGAISPGPRNAALAPRPAKA